MVEQLLTRGNSLLESLEQGKEKENLEAKLGESEARWNDAKQRSRDHSNRVAATIPQAEDYNDALNNHTTWLTDTELKLTSLQPVGSSLHSLDKLEHAIQLLRKDIDARSAERDAVDGHSKAVINLAEADIDIIEEEAHNAVERYDKLNAACAQKEKDLIELQDLCTRYYSHLKPLDKMLSEIEAVLESQGPVGGDMEKIKMELNKIKVTSTNVRTVMRIK